MPAGTGVCVVNTVPARTASIASANESPPLGDHLADALEPEEAGVALVGVEDLAVLTNRLERTHAADAEEDLLAQAVLGAAAVQAVGDAALVVRVVVDVGVEQVERDPPDLPAPHLCVAGGARQVDRHSDPFDRLEGHRVRVELHVALALPAVGVELLAEVALAVEQADADERDAERRRRLQVVAGEHAEAAGVLRDRLGDAELGREVRDPAERAGGSRPWNHRGISR